MVDRETRTCKESEAACLAPAGYQVGGLGGAVGNPDPKSCRGTCFACGEPVCSNCSTLVQWYRHGRRRACYGCQVDHARDKDRLRGDGSERTHKALEKRIMARLQRLVNA
jgi:hypothetical protein